LTSLQMYLAKSIIYEAPNYAVFSTLLSLHPSSIQILPSAPSSVSLCSSLNVRGGKVHTQTQPQAEL
jgi:hypothetical protein